MTPMMTHLVKRRLTLLVGVAFVGDCEHADVISLATLISELRALFEATSFKDSVLQLPDS